MNSPAARLAPEAEIGREPRIQLVPPHRLRALAALTDLAIVALVIEVMPPTDYFFIFTLGFLIAYHTVLISLLQQTVGKALFGLKVERAGKKPKFFWALARASLGYCAADLFGIGLLASLVNHDRRCFHDYVFGTRVYFQGPEKVTIRRLFYRLMEYARKQSAAEGAKKAAILGGLWDFLQKIASGANWIIDKVLGLQKSAPIKSSLGILSTKAAVTLGILATAITVTSSVYVRPLHEFTDRLLTPHVLNRPPDGWGKCSCPGQHPYIGVIYKGDRWHKGGYECQQ